MLDPRVLSLLACPRCITGAMEQPTETMIVCMSCGIRFPVNHNIPMMLISEAIPLEPLYQDASIPSDSRELDRVLVVCEEHWDEVIKRLATEPNDLYAMSPRKFEELVAELLLREGFRVQLTPETRDGGRDILAFADTRVGSHLHLVECKRYAPNRPISVDLVRNLYGVVEAERATSGLLVATCDFTRDAQRFRATVKHRLTLRGKETLKEWLRGCNPSQPSRN